MERKMLNRYLKGKDEFKKKGGKSENCYLFKLLRPKGQRSNFKLIYISEHLVRQCLKLITNQDGIT